MKPFKSYPGSKNGSGVYQTIINQIPPHTTYIEAFLGNGAILANKLPALLNIGIDINPKIIEAWELQNAFNFKFICQDAVTYLNNLILGPAFKESPENVFIYLDPPYLLNSRSHKSKIYKFEFTEKQHIELLKIIVQLPFNVAISCYPNELYERILKNWRKIEFKSQTRTHTATEVLYMNYCEPTELHDYRYIGDDFRERERIRQKIKRHVNGLLRLPELERKAIIHAIQNRI